MQRLLSQILLAAMVWTGCTAAVTAQNMFRTVATVNERAVTAYEVDQRAQLLTLFNTPGDVRERALESLIDERIQLAAAEDAGITVTEEEIRDGQSEFAGRADLSREQFVAQIQQQGIAPESFRDFVRAGIAWRKTVEDRFGGSVNISETEIDRAAAAPEEQPGLRVLLSEIVLPARNAQERAQAQQVAQRIAGSVTSLQGFAAAARENSASPSRERGGRIDWLPLTNLPPNLRPVILDLSPGQVSAPIDLPNAVAVFQLRALEETGTAQQTPETIDYASFLIPGGRSQQALSEAARIDALADTCDDLYGLAEGLPPQQLERQTAAPGQIPQDVALQLARLDQYETSTALTRNDGQTLVFLMLCERSYADPASEVDRGAIRRQLVNQRISRRADNYLAELKSNAYIAIN
ncbi:periplasmic chaperone for outer membrane proteins SurA [Tranquillimonas rosea]|uniref:Parvulin-like PPIase n=1 Tax=Tranquillimonas rosea TaxID=641238 RepID=A0A1H9PJR5_9RHOB|nr:peptidylprolyl isomerase [Tranquillimonas rosea]SER48452.1 periplasmic chaperone for outer membrane proteins SurA [Tranquillimonas rosea]